MKLFSVAILVSLLLAIPAIAGEAIDDGATPVLEGATGYTGPVWDGPKAVLWDNGPIVTSVGTGVGGADESIVDATETTNGFGCYYLSDLRLADDFTVPAGESWYITKITLFGYQTDSPGTASTITTAYIEIWDNPPEFGTLVYGDMITNVLTSTQWMNCYRVQYSASGTNVQRPIMANVCEFSSPIILTEGDYWLCWQLDGTEASGPWTPPITINGTLVTGDAYQYYQSSWSIIADATSGNYKGLPFILEDVSSLDNATWASIKTVF
jgi:hypothetical protein